MKNEVQERESLLNKISKYCIDQNKIRSFDNNWTRIITPVLDRHNDYFDVYVRTTESGFEITDDRYTITDTEMSVFVDDAIISKILGFHRVDRDGDSLVVNVTEDNFYEGLMNLLFAMRKISNWGD